MCSLSYLCAHTHTNMYMETRSRRVCTYALTQGSYFGEKCVLGLSTTRPVSVRAITWCSLFFLTQVPMCPYVSLCVLMLPLYVALYVSSYCPYIVLMCVLTQVPRVSICVLICVLVCDKCVLTYILILS